MDLQLGLGGRTRGLGSNLHHLEFRSAAGSGVAAPSASPFFESDALENGSWQTREILDIFDQAQPLEAECTRPEEWTISVDDSQWGWVIVSQLADPQWQAHWIGLDGQGDVVGKILPTFRKGNEPGGWQRVKLPGPGRWTLRLSYEAHDVAEGVAISIMAWALLDHGRGFDCNSKCVRPMDPHRGNPDRGVT